LRIVEGADLSLFGQMKWRWLRRVIMVVCAVALAFVGYVRLAPSDPNVWHQRAYPSGMDEKVSAKGYIWRQKVVGDGTDQLRKLDQIIMETNRTTQLAGSIEDKQITYVTRSSVIGFPDYTTIGIYEGLIEDGDHRYLEVNARLRFGSLDFGVNAKRVKGWLSQFQAGR
jgi:uncharacterized protein (DUF1499 family)